MKRKEELDEFFAQMLVTMEEARLVTLERVMHDGTKVRPRGRSDVFQSVKERLEKARELVKEDPQGGRTRREAAQQRDAARAGGALNESARGVADDPGHRL